ncbi:MAG TPA: dihydrofolate reductase family protein [Bryobacteraceae bacterium]|nr:dihydrofolate reductase family protein [Bryobacteraceae bacterium]
MREIVYGCGVSMDGYIARPDGGLDWLVHEPSHDMGAFFKTIDAGIMGRKTYEAGVKAGGEAQFKSGGIQYFVFSRTELPGKRRFVEWVNEAPRTFVDALRAKPGKNIWLAGGGELARTFLEEDLIDRVEIGIVPVLLGAGIPMFPAGFPERKFELIECRAYPKGLVTASYRRSSY